MSVDERAAVERSSVLPAPAKQIAEDLLARLDRALPARIEGFYVVGSASIGAFRDGRSDVDFVAVADRELSRTELARLGAVHLGRWTSALVRDVAMRRRWPFVCNGIYVRAGDLARPPLDVTPVAAHVSGRFRTAQREGFDVSPVTWHILARHGISLRGPDRERLRVHVDAAELRAWTRGNLSSYWQRWVERVRRPGVNRATVLGRRFIAGGVLGAPRLHYTLALGEIVSKEAAGVYALEAFEPRWRPLIEDALAYWREAPSAPRYRRHPGRRRHDAAAFVAHVIDSGNAL
ncbi:MAG: aminoglycoside adenylyltransferase domain-containing protein [Solirubrobacteraceae bacterium]